MCAAGWSAVLLRLAYLTVTNAFAALRLLPLAIGTRTSRFSPYATRSPSLSGSSGATPGEIRAQGPSDFSPLS